MKVYYDRKSKDPIYYVQHGFRNGNKATTRNILRVGKHSELLKTHPDPLAFAKQEAQRLTLAMKEGKLPLTLTIDFDEKLTYTEDIAAESDLLNIGYFVLQQIYHDIGIKEFFRPIQEKTKVSFSLDDINRFMTFAKNMGFRSKRAACASLSNFYEMPEIKYQNILRFMDILEPHYEEYLVHLFHGSEKVIHRNTSVCYFDCTNFYFEIEEADQEYTDPVTGEVLPGLRKYGLSKQHQPAPLVQMGLFMDGNGIPISMCITPGNENEQSCAVPLEKKIVSMFRGKKFIYCADAGLGSYHIRKFNDMGGRSFIITQSLKKMADIHKQAVFNDYDYKLLSNDAPVSIKAMKTFDKEEEKNLALYNDFAYKRIPVDKALDLGLYEEKRLKNGTVKQVKAKGILKQYVIITFSRKLMEYQRHIRNAQVERAEKLLATRDPESIKKGPNDVRRFITRKAKKDGDPADRYEIDHEKIKEEEMYDGYYAVATNLDDDAKEILAIARQRYKIEECFRIMKTDLSARPIFHRNRPRIIAHFMICYTALLLQRLLENRLDRYGTHFTTEQIIQTLKNMSVTNLEDMAYKATFKYNQVGEAFNGLFGLGLNKKYYKPKELNKTIKKISK